MIIAETTKVPITSVSKLVRIISRFRFIESGSEFATISGSDKSLMYCIVERSSLNILR